MGDLMLQSRYLRLTFYPKYANRSRQFFLELEGLPHSLAIRDKSQIMALKDEGRRLSGTLEQRRSKIEDPDMVRLLEESLVDEPWVIPADDTHITHVIYVRFRQGPKLLRNEFGRAGTGIMSPCAFEDLVRLAQHHPSCPGGEKVGKSDAWDLWKKPEGHSTCHSAYLQAANGTFSRLENESCRQHCSSATGEVSCICAYSIDGSLKLAAHLPLKLGPDSKCVQIRIRLAKSKRNLMYR